MPSSPFAIALIFWAASPLAVQGQEPSDVVDAIAPAVSAVLKDTHGLNKPGAVIIEVMKAIAVASPDTSAMEASSGESPGTRSPSLRCGNPVTPGSCHLVDRRAVVVRVADFSISGDSGLVKLEVMRETDSKRQPVFHAWYEVHLVRTGATSAWRVSSKKLIAIT
jgi:hypothetical protein